MRGTGLGEQRLEGVQEALIGVGVALAVVFVIGTFHRNFGLAEGPFGIEWLRYAAVAVVVAQLVRLPRLEPTARGGVVLELLGILGCLVGLGPAVVCKQSIPPQCEAVFSVTPLVLLAGIGLLGAGVFAELRSGR